MRAVLLSDHWFLHQDTIPDDGQTAGRLQDVRGGGGPGPEVEQEDQGGEM